VICPVIQTNESYLELNLDCMANAVAVSSLSLHFLNCLMGQVHGGALLF